MKASVDIEAGICGFRTHADLLCEDEQNISSCKMTSDCEKIGALAASLVALMPLDAYSEISQASESRLLTCCRETLQGCCSGCATPIGLYRAMQVAAGLALPKDVHIHVSKES